MALGIKRVAKKPKIGKKNRQNRLNSVVFRAFLFAEPYFLFKLIFFGHRHWPCFEDAFKTARRQASEWRLPKERDQKVKEGK